MDQQTWQFINAAAWFSAIATFAAVVVALYLARKNDRISLDVHAGIRSVGRVNKPGGSYILFRPGSIPDSSEALQIVWVNVTNIGRRNVTITLLVWRPVPWRNRGLPLIPRTPGSTDDIIPSADFPITLNDGQAAAYSWPLSEFVSAEAATEFRDQFTGFSGSLRLQLLRMCVSTSTGDVFRCKPEKELRELLRTMATAQKKTV
jgi:hypothetical protein